jgi:hypothetical protein
VDVLLEVVPLVSGQTWVVEGDDPSMHGKHAKDTPKSVGDVAPASVLKPCVFER